MRRSWVLTNPAAPSTSEMTLGYLSVFSLWLGPIFSFFTAFLHHSSYFFSLTKAMVGNFSALLLLLLSSVLRHCLQLGLERSWPGKSRHCTCVGAATVCKRVIDTSQTRPLALIRCVDAGMMDSCIWNFPADLYLILLSDHKDNFSKYNNFVVGLNHTFITTCPLVNKFLFPLSFQILSSLIS